MVSYSAHTPSDEHESKNHGNYFLRIEEGPFMGVEFSFKDIAPKTEDENGNFHVDYDYDLWFRPKNINANLTIADFEGVIEEILHHIINEVAENIVVDDVESPESLLEEPLVGEEFESHEIISKEITL